MSVRSLAALASTLFFAAAAAVSAAQGTPSPSPGDLSGEWEMTTVVLSNPLVHRLTIKVERGKLTGTVSRGKPTPITGTVAADQVRFESKDPDGTVENHS